MRLHTDASHDPDGVIGIAYVIRDDVEDIQVDGKQYVHGDFTSMEAEYHALMSGLHAASWWTGDTIVIQTDCQPLVDKMYYPDAYSEEWYQRRKDFHEIANTFDTWKLNHVGRASNQHADRLAKEALYRGREEQ